MINRMRESRDGLKDEREKAFVPCEIVELIVLYNNGCTGTTTYSVLINASNEPESQTAMSLKKTWSFKDTVFPAFAELLVRHFTHGLPGCVCVCVCE